MPNFRMLNSIARRNGFYARKGNGELPDNYGGYRIYHYGVVVAGMKFNIPEEEIASCLWSHLEREPMMILNQRRKDTKTA